MRLVGVQLPSVHVQLPRIGGWLRLHWLPVLQPVHGQLLRLHMRSAELLVRNTRGQLRVRLLRMRVSVAVAPADVGAVGAQRTANSAAVRSANVSSDISRHRCGRGVDDNGGSRCILREFGGGGRFSTTALPTLSVPGDQGPTHSAQRPMWLPSLTRPLPTLSAPRLMWLRSRRASRRSSAESASPTSPTS